MNFQQRAAKSRTEKIRQWKIENAKHSIIVEIKERRFERIGSDGIAAFYDFNREVI
jgi:hypothetical protein